MRPGVCTVFSPRKTHEVLPWEGIRTVVIAYTPQCLGKLDQGMVNELELHGFTVPLTQLPEYFAAEGAGLSQIQMEDPEPDVIYDDYVSDSEMEEWDMFMEVDSGLVKIGDSEASNEERDVPYVSKVEVAYTMGVEEILKGLQSPLEVTYTVDPREVQRNLELWRPAIEREISSVGVAIW